MSNTMSVQQAAAKLPELIGSLSANEEIILTDGERAVAKIVSTRKPGASRLPGSARGMLTIVSEDDDHLEDFKEHMP